VASELRGKDPNEWSTVSHASVTDFFHRQGKRVIYFAGYSELGYQETGCVRRITRDVLSDLDASSVLVLCCSLLRVNGQDGIAEVYHIAKELEFETVGIHPSVARCHGDTHRVSPYCDHVFFVSDDTWGGYLAETDIPSRTLSLQLAVSDEMVIIGGGKHAADEMRAFFAAQKKVHYFPADMNLAVSRRWCAQIGVDLIDQRGAAHHAWAHISSHAQAH
jgi:hypothetical protein